MRKKVGHRTPVFGSPVFEPKIFGHRKPVSLPLLSKPRRETLSLVSLFLAFHARRESSTWTRVPSAMGARKNLDYNIFFGLRS